MSYMRAWWLSILPLLICAPCVAVSLGVAGVLTAGLVTAAGLFTTPVGMALLVAVSVGMGVGARAVVRRRRACHTPLSKGRRA
jgi:hypothetical protein